MKNKAQEGIQLDNAELLATQGILCMKQWAFWETFFKLFPVSNKLLARMAKFPLILCVKLLVMKNLAFFAKFANFAKL